MHREVSKGHSEILELIKEEGYAHFKVTIISKGRVTIPIVIRNALNLKVGDQVELILKTSNRPPIPQEIELEGKRK